MARKGSSFEREVCKKLSLWWTEGEDDSCFWRTSQSGGRATVRGRKGKGTRGHCGDICATDSEGEPLVRLITFELKRGYNRAELHQLLDKPPRAKLQTYQEWIVQATRAAKRAGTPYWAIIHKRDMREVTVTVPRKLIAVFDLYDVHPRVMTYVRGRERLVEIMTLRLDDFLGAVSRKDVTQVLETYNV